MFLVYALRDCAMQWTWTDEWREIATLKAPADGEKNMEHFKCLNEMNLSFLYS